jgi:cystathionine beta-lyase/cystathionine gamma-synthase
MADISTQLIHHPYLPPADFAAPQPGVFKASTVIFPNVAAMRARDWKDKSGYTYGLHGTPTTFLLEERLCDAGRRQAVRARAQRFGWQLPTWVTGLAEDGR